MLLPAGLCRPESPGVLGGCTGVLLGCSFLSPCRGHGHRHRGIAKPLASFSRLLDSVSAGGTATWRSLRSLVARAEESWVEVRDGVLEDLPSVLELLKRSKATVGFLPDEAVEQRIHKGTLLVAVRDGKVVGYLLYDLPGETVTIRQLVVAPDARGDGAARAMVDQLVRRHQDTRHSIRLTCRRDYEANDVWHRLGFSPRGERKGRGKGEKVLTLWTRSFGHPDLFSMALEQDDRPLAALDTNLLIRGADGDVEVRQHLLSDWVRAEVMFGFIDYSLVEINRQDDTAVRPMHIRYVNGFDEIAYQARIAETLQTNALEALGTTANSHLGDIMLATRAAAGGARWFVSEDLSFRSACAGALSEIAGIEVVSVADLVLAADQLVRGELYNGRYLQGTDIEVREVAPGDIDAVARTFLNQRAGETFRAWRKQLETLVSDVVHTHMYLFRDRSGPIGVAAVTSGEIVEVPVCRVRRGPAEPTMARQLLGWLRDKCLEMEAPAIRITDEHCGQWIDDRWNAEGFLPDEYPTAVPITGATSIAGLAAILAAPPLADRIDPKHAEQLNKLTASPAAAHSVEGVFHPVIVTDAGLRTVRVPIKLPYAIELFDYTLSAGRLWGRDRSVALRREHVYFRTPSARSLLTAPARVLWHVTGDKRHGGATLRARSLLDEVVVGDVDQLISRFSHLGVLNRDEIACLARDGQVMALRFSHTTMFPRPITLDEYRRVMAELEPGVGLTHAGPQPVNERTFVYLATVTP